MPPAHVQRYKPRRGSAARLGERARLVLLAGGFLAVFGLLLVLVETGWPPLWELDRSTSEGLHDVAVQHAWLVTAMKTISLIGSSGVYVPLFTAIVATLAWRREFRLAVFAAVTVAGSSLLNSTVKALVGRERPVFADPVAHAGASSFPSGHAQSSVVLTSVLLVLFLPMLHGRRRVVAVTTAVVWALAVGFSRVGLGVHYVSDVLAGYALGAAWVLLLVAAADLAARLRPPNARAPLDRRGRPRGS